MLRILGLGYNIGHGLFVGWVEHPDIFCWVSFLNPTYLPAIFVISAKPNKIAEDKIIPRNSIDFYEFKRQSATRRKRLCCARDSLLRNFAVRCSVTRSLVQGMSGARNAGTET